VYFKKYCILAPLLLASDLSSFICSSHRVHWNANNLSVIVKMTFGYNAQHHLSQSEEKLLCVQMYYWLHTHGMLDITCYPAFIGASDIISSVNMLIPRNSYLFKTACRLWWTQARNPAVATILTWWGFRYCLRANGSQPLWGWAIASRSWSRMCLSAAGTGALRHSLQSIRYTSMSCKSVPFKVM